MFIRELLVKLQGLQKQEDLHNDGIDLPQLHIYPTRSGSADREVLHWDSKRSQSDTWNQNRGSWSKKQTH